ncbi:MAG: hypothetical protein ACKPGX_08165, partial [Dolichospermum sp.]
QWGVICIELFRSNTPKSLCCKEFSQLVPLSDTLPEIIVKFCDKVQPDIRIFARLLEGFCDKSP